MSELLLSVEIGRERGTRPARRLRREGKIPAVVYGLDANTVAVSVPWPTLRQALTTDAGLNALITVQIDGEQHLCVIKELQRHPVRRDVLHVDFMRVRADRSIDVEVPLVLVGEALEVTRADGMVDQTLYTLTISAMPAAVPDEIEVDITDLEIGSSVKVGELVLPPGASTSVDPDEAVCTALITRSTREAIARAEAEAGEAAAEAGEAAADGASVSDSDGN